MKAIELVQIIQRHHEPEDEIVAVIFKDELVWILKEEEVSKVTTKLENIGENEVLAHKKAPSQERSQQIFIMEVRSNWH